MNHNNDIKNKQDQLKSQTKDQAKKSTITPNMLTQSSSTRLAAVKSKILKAASKNASQNISEKLYENQNNIKKSQYSTAKQTQQITALGDDTEVQDKQLESKNVNPFVNQHNQLSNEENKRYGANLGLMINFAKIVGTHGVKGFFVADCYFSNPAEYLSADKVYFYDKKIKLKIEGTKTASQGQIALILSNPLINTPEKAKEMVGKFLKCQKADIPQAPKEGQYTVAHLIGLKAYYAGSSNIIGKITDVADLFGDIMLEITMQDDIANTAKKEYVLFNDINVREINIKNDFIILNKIEYIEG